MHNGKERRISVKKKVNSYTKKKKKPKTFKIMPLAFSTAVLSAWPF